MAVQERSQRTREAILAAASAEFAEQGFAGARMDAIAEGAGANKQRIYAYYGSKAGLFQAVQADAIAKLTACEEAILARAEAEPGLLSSHLRDGYIAFHRDHPEFRRILAWANLAGIVTGDGSTAQRAAGLQRLKQVFIRAQGCGGAPPGAEFEPWLVAVTAIVFFIFSNQRTASINLGLRLADATAAEELARSAIALLEAPGAKRG